ncbi:MAG: type II toxin-antitoxin system toxin DhiT [Brevinema sp.]
MPVIARFYGLIIKMYFQQREHNPPHVHIVYGEYIGVININTQEMIEGDLPPKAQDMAREWVRLYQKDLIEIWNTQVFKQLPPLE